MTDFQTMCKAFDDTGIKYTVREDGDFQYVFIGDYQDIHDLNGSFETTDLDRLLSWHRYFEFEQGSLASYPNF